MSPKDLKRDPLGIRFFVDKVPKSIIRSRIYHSLWRFNHVAGWLHSHDEDPRFEDFPRYKKPVTVLTSGFTFSAAEDFVSSFQSAKIGPIIGSPTAGSTGQPLFFSLPGGGSVRICAKYTETALGVKFLGKGLQPDIPVAEKALDFAKGRDATLERALEYLKTGK